MTIRRSQIDCIRAACVLLLIVPVQSAWSQQPEAVPQPPPPATGTVTGHVISQETKLPLRFAEIRLVPTPTEDQLRGAADQTATANPPKPHLVRVQGISNMDGSFRMEDVPVGDYYAGALMEGYLAAGPSASANATDDQLKLLIASMPTVHVAPGQVASVDLMLRRGAVIAGRVLFADGSPAIGTSVSWELEEANLAFRSVRLAWPTPLQQIIQDFDYYTSHEHRTTTDEEGRFRFFGLEPGNYIVETAFASQTPSAAQVVLNDGSSPDPGKPVYRFLEMTIVYAPGVFRRTDAKVIQIRGGEEVTNLDLKIDPRGLRTVRGRVLAGEDRHVPSQAMVRIQEDGGKDPGKFVVIHEDGSFQIDNLLPGSYTLQVTGVDEERSTGNPPDAPRLSRSYQLAKVPVVVGSRDVVVADVLLTALKPGERMEYPQ